MPPTSTEPLYMPFTEIQNTPTATEHDVPHMQPEEMEAGGKENLKQISMTISASDLKRVDAAAKRMRVSRAGFIRNAIFKAIPDKE